MDFLVDMFGIRDPYQGELSYFKNRPEVAGMMTEDNKITLNPYSKNTPEQQQQVAKNEAIRLFLKLKKISPEFDLTSDQKDFFKNSEYANNLEEAKKSIVARILTNDSSMQEPSKEQIDFANSIKDLIMLHAPRGAK